MQIYMVGGAVRDALLGLPVLWLIWRVSRLPLTADTQNGAPKT